MNSVMGWSLALAALVLGYWQWGWQGLILAFSVIVFWLLLQFSRVLRVLRQAGANPVGHVDSAVMLHARLQRGMRLMDVLLLTRSLGQRVSERPEAYLWEDNSGAHVRIELEGGRLQRWSLQRPDEGSAPPP